MKRHHVAAVLLVVALTASGCGKSNNSSNAASRSMTTAAASGSGGTTTTVKGATTTTTTVKGATTTTTTVKGATTTTTKPRPTTTTVPVTAKVDKACVHPGDPQGLTVTANSRGQVIYDTVYSDKSDDLTAHYGTGSGRGDADDKGVYHTTWVLSPKVPPGPAYVNVAATNGGDVVRASTNDTQFVIKGIGQPC